MNLRMWSYLGAVLIGLTIGSATTAKIYSIRMHNKVERVRKEELAHCQTIVNTLQTQQSQYNGKITDNHDRANRIISRVCSPSANGLSTETSGYDPKTGYYRMDRAHFLQLTRLAEQCADDSAAAEILNSAWK